MVLIPSLSSMLLVIGIALAIAAVASAAVGVLFNLAAERRHVTPALKPARSALQVRRTSFRQPVSTH